jgi:DNA-binding IclR family transcriptional regulator
MAEDAKGGVAAVERALSILQAFTEQDETLSLVDLAARTGLYKSTILRLAESLGQFGFLERTPDGRFRIGPGAWRVGSLFVRNMRLEERLQPLLTELSGQTEESVSFYVPMMMPPPPARVCVLRADSPHPVRDHVRIGDRLPFDAGSGGRILRAYIAPRDATDEAARRAGYCASYGERLPEIGGIAAPVFGAEHQLVGSLTLSAPTSRRDKGWFSEHIPILKDFARRGTELLGGRVQA